MDRCQVTRLLDEEHRANLSLLRRVEQALAAPNQARGQGELMAAFGRQFDQEVRRHFEFEERDLFPRLNDGGAGDLAALLMEEHDAIRAVADDLLPLARAAAAGELDGPGWDALRRNALEMVERLTAHIDKETIALLPVLDNLLDEDTDRDLAFAYSTA